MLSTGEKYYKMILNTPTQLTPKDIETSKTKLAAMKFHPREQESNLALVARAERLYESYLGEERERILQILRWFESVLERQDPKEVTQAQEELTLLLDRFEQDRLF